MDNKQLISIIKKHEAVYNKDCAEYDVSAIRNATWLEISKESGKSVEECKAKWSKLRHCYTNALLRRRRHKAVSVRKGRYRQWKFEEEMSFLEPHVELKARTLRYLKHADEDSEDSLKSNKTDQHSNSTHLSVDNQNKQSEQIDQDVKQENNDVWCPDPEEDESPLDQRMLSQSWSQESQPSQKLEDIDYFFLSMSKTLKKLPRRVQIQLQLDFHRAVAKAELEHLDDDQFECTNNPLL